MGLFQKLKDLDQRADAILSHQESIATPNAANLRVTSPAKGEEWTPGEYVEVTWQLQGPVTGQLDIALVVPTGETYGELAYLLVAEDVDPAKGSATFVVPDVAPGEHYAVGFANDDPLTVYSQAITITAPS
jgi:hypothetical protein